MEEIRKRQNGLRLGGSVEESRPRRTPPWWLPKGGADSSGRPIVWPAASGRSTEEVKMERNEKHHNGGIRRAALIRRFGPKWFPIAIVLWYGLLATPIYARKEISPYQEKKLFEVHRTYFSNDTLICDIWSLEPSNYYFYPLGEYSEWTAFQIELKRNFSNWEFRRDKGNSIRHTASFGPDSLALRFTNRSEIRKYEIEFARILSIRINLRNGVQTGLGKSAFFQIFFDKYPIKDISKCRVFETRTGPIDDMGRPSKRSIRHFYEFKDNRLHKIEIKTDYFGGRND
jgi:hypothetical protein